MDSGVICSNTSVNPVCRLRKEIKRSSRFADLSFFCFSPIAIWSVTKRTRYRTQTAKIRFFCRVASHRLRDKSLSSGGVGF